MTKLYVIRCGYTDGIELWDMYWNDEWGWSTGIEDAKFFHSREGNLPVGVDNETYIDVEWVELEVNDD